LIDLDSEVGDIGKVYLREELLGKFVPSQVSAAYSDNRLGFNLRFSFYGGW